MLQALFLVAVAVLFKMLGGVVLSGNRRHLCCTAIEFACTFVQHSADLLMLLAWLHFVCVGGLIIQAMGRSGQSCKTMAATTCGCGPELLVPAGCSCTERQRQAWAKQHGGYLADQLGSVREASGRVQVCWCLLAVWTYVFNVRACIMASGPFLCMHYCHSLLSLWRQLLVQGASGVMAGTA